MKQVWGESYNEFNDFIKLYRHTQELDECCTTADVELLKTVIVLGSKLLMKFASEKPESIDQIEEILNVLHNQLTMLGWLRSQ